MKLKLIVPVILIAFFVIACKHEIPLSGKTGNGNVVNSSTCSVDSVYFGNTILPVISSGCAITGCHDPATHEEGLVLNSYTGIMELVQPGNATGSKLYGVISTTNPGDIMPPPPHAPFSPYTISLIQKWINQGAKNNQCTASCDTAVFTFSGAVTPVMNNFCKGCHNPASLGGGIDLSAYSGVRSVAINGKLMGSINHASGYIAMPQGSNKLPDCQIRQIEKWIQAGAAIN